MAHLQYMPGDPRLVDQLVYELKSKGIFDQFRKDCIADVDTRPAYQNLRQRVENSVSSFLSRQVWKPDLNKNQLREKLRKHILDGNYLEQGVERIVDQVVNPKVASVFIPQVEDLVYNYLGISRKKSVTAAETSNGKLSTDDLLPEDLEAVSPGSVKSNEDKTAAMDQDFNEETKMEVDIKDEDKPSLSEIEKLKIEGDSQTAVIELNTDSDENTEKNNMTMHDGINLDNIPAPDNSPPKAEAENIDIDKIELPIQPITMAEIRHPDEIPLPKDDKEQYFKPIVQDPNSDDDSSSDSSLRRNMSPLTPIRNYNNENSCDAQQAFENDSDSKSDDKKEPSSFRFAIEAKSPENNSLDTKPEKKDPEQTNLAYQFNNQVNINTFNTPLYDDSSNSNNLQIDYESDVNSKINAEKVPEADQNSEDKREKKNDERKSSHKSSHRSRDSHRHSSSKDKRSDSKQSNSRDSSRLDKKPKDDHSKSKSSRDKEREKSRERSDKKDSRDSSKHRSSSHKSSSSHRDSKDSKSHRSSSSSQKHSSDKRSDDKKSSSSHKSERSSEKSSDRSSRDKRDSKSGSHRSDKDKKSSSKSKHDEKDKKKEKKDTDDHYSLSGRGNHSRRSTDRDSNDGSSSSKGSQNPSGPKPAENKKETKGSSSKSENTSTASESTSPSDKDHRVTTASGTKTSQKPIRVENHLENPIASPPRLPFVPDITLKKPKFAANLAEAKRMMKMRKFLDEEQKRMNQEAALLLEFQANVRPSLSQVYSSIPGPELEFACIANEVNSMMQNKMCKTEKGEDEKSTNESKAKVQEKDTKNIKTETTKNEDKNKVTTEIIDELEDTLTNDTEMFDDSDTKLDKSETYNENKPFSQLMEEISEYSKASEKNKKDALDNLVDDENKKRTEFFEVTIITEELSETDEPAINPGLEGETDSIESIEIEVPLSTDTTIVSEVEKTKSDNTQDSKPDDHEDSKPKTPESPKPEEHEDTLKYFAENEILDAELKRHQYSDFLKAYIERNVVSNKIHIINCDTYEENILREVCATFGTFELINYYKNGHLKLPKTEKKVVKNVNLASEISLPMDNSFATTSPVFSPVKSECSFELSSDYDAKLEEMVNKTSRQQVMEIILGNVIDDENPSIDYCTESSIDNELHLKRKIGEVEGPENNNRQVLKKVRKVSDSDQISSTTEESEEVSNNNRVSRPTRSKYLGRARRVGLARPRRNNLPNSPSSDKSVENYEQNTQTSAQTQTPNGKFKSVTRNKVQRYDTSDLYKPKLHYLSRRNNIS